MMFFESIVERGRFLSAFLMVEDVEQIIIQKVFCGSS